MFACQVFIPAAKLWCLHICTDFFANPLVLFISCTQPYQVLKHCASSCLSQCFIALTSVEDLRWCRAMLLSTQYPHRVSRLTQCASTHRYMSLKRRVSSAASRRWM